MVEIFRKIPPDPGMHGPIEEQTAHFDAEDYYMGVGVGVICIVALAMWFFV